MATTGSENVTSRSATSWALGLVVGWVAVGMFVGLGGEYAINDDFAYMWAVRVALEEGRFERLPWTWVPILTSTGWGVLFSGLSGFSIVALRLSSFVASGIGVLALFQWLRESGADNRIAFLGAAALAANPIYQNLAFTFMTEPFFLACSLTSLAAYARSLRTGSLGAFVFGTVFAVAATLSRQVGLALPLAYGVAALVGTRDAGRVIRTVVANAVVAGAYAAFVFWIASQGTSEVYGVSELASDAATFNALWHVSRHAVESVATLGLFVAPLLLLIRPRSWAAWGFGIGALVVTGTVLALGSSPAPWGNILRTSGVGPSGILGEWELPAIPRAFQWALTALGGGGAGALVATVLHAIRADGRAVLGAPRWLLPVAFGAAILGPHLTRSPFFDRYILLAAGPAIVLIALVFGAGRLARGAWLATATVVVLVGGFSAVEARFSGDRARAQWALLEPEIPLAANVDGGFGWNGFHYDWVEMPIYPPETRLFVNEMDQALSFERAMEGCEPVRSVEVSRIWGMTPQRLTLFRRLDETPAP